MVYGSVLLPACFKKKLNMNLFHPQGRFGVRASQAGVMAPESEVILQDFAASEVCGWRELGVRAKWHVPHPEVSGRIEKYQVQLHTHLPPGWE